MKTVNDILNAVTAKNDIYAVIADLMDHASLFGDTYYSAEDDFSSYSLNGWLIEDYEFDHVTITDSKNCKLTVPYPELPELDPEDEDPDDSRIRIVYRFH